MTRKRKKIPKPGRPLKSLIYDQKTAVLTKEEMDIREENLQYRPFCRTEGVRALWAAVAVRAVRDYNAVRKQNDKHAESEKTQLQDFFNSELFGEITNGLEANDVDIQLEKNSDVLKMANRERRSSQYESA